MTLVMSRYDLDTVDIRRIALEARCCDQTVESFLDGRPGRVRTRMRLIAAMHLLGFGHLIPESEPIRGRLAG